MARGAADLPKKLGAYVAAMGARETAVQRALRKATRKLPMAGMQIGPDQAALMQLLVRAIGAKRCLEIGTFTGYSALAVALALPPGGRIVASAMAGYDGHRGWVNYLAVAPEARGKGYGRLLMRYIEEALRARGCPKLNIQVRAGNDEALRFYEKIGYSTEARVSLGRRLIED